MKRLPGATLAAALLAGCNTMIDHEKVEDWPQLAVYEHYVPNLQMRDRCVKYTPIGASPLACAEFNFVERRCDIWYSAEFPPSQAVIDHERMHCAGYDHVGEKTMRAILDRYLAATRGTLAQK